MLTHSFHIFLCFNNFKMKIKVEFKMIDCVLFKDGPAITKSSYVITEKFSQFAAAPLTYFLFVPFFHVGGKI